MVLYKDKHLRRTGVRTYYFMGSVASSSFRNSPEVGRAVGLNDGAELTVGLDEGLELMVGLAAVICSR